MGLKKIVNTILSFLLRKIKIHVFFLIIISTMGLTYVLSKFNIQFKIENISYFYSTIAQVVAALIGLLGIFVVFSVELIDSQINTAIIETKIAINEKRNILVFPYIIPPFPNEWNLPNCIEYLGTTRHTMEGYIEQKQKEQSENVNKIEQIKSIKTILDVVDSQIKRLRKIYLSKQEFLESFKLPMKASLFTIVINIFFLIYTIKINSFCIIKLIFIISAMTIYYIFDYIFQINRIKRKAYD